MFSRILVAALLALPMIVSAAPTNNPGKCNVGDLHCCNTKQESGGTNANAGGLLGLPLNLIPFIAADCTPISVLGIGGNSCTAQPVCCEGNQFIGGVNILNCSPLNVNL